MPRLSMAFLVLGLIAGVFGFTVLAGGASQIAWILSVIFLVFFLVSLLMSRPRTAASSRDSWATAVAHSCKYVRFRCQP